MSLFGFHRSSLWKIGWPLRTSDESVRKSPGGDDQIDQNDPYLSQSVRMMASRRLDLSSNDPSDAF